MSFTYALTGKGNPSTVLRSDGREIPQDPANADYLLWVAFTTGGGVTTPAPEVTLEDLRDLARAEISKRAASAATLATASQPRDAIYSALRFREGQDYVDPTETPDIGFPLLLSEVDTNGDDTGEVRDFVQAELAALKLRLAQIAEYQRQLYADVAGASTQGEIDAVVAGADFAEAPGIFNLLPTRLELRLPAPVLRKVEPAVFAVGTGTASEGASVDLPLPAGDLSDKVLVAVILSRDDAVNSPVMDPDDADWQAIRTDTVNSRLISVFVADGADVVDPATFANGGCTGMYGQIFALSNTSKAAVAAAVGAVTHTSASVTVTAPSVTPAADNTGILFLAFAIRAAAIATCSGYSGVDPTLTEVADSGAVITVLTQRFSIAAAFGLQTTAGATGDRTGTLSGSASSNFGLMVVVPPV